MKTIRMPKELLDKWLAALRSGEYKQTRERLSDGSGGYCCLGVLQQCESGKVWREDADCELPHPLWLERRGIVFDTGFGNSSNSPYLPDLCDTAANANDGGKTFAQIADAIEACAEGV